MGINYRTSDHIIDSIDAFIAEVIGDLDRDNQLYVLDGLSDVISNQRYDIAETLSNGDAILQEVTS